MMSRSYLLLSFAVAGNTEQNPRNKNGAIAETRIEGKRTLAASATLVMNGNLCPKNGSDDDLHGMPHCTLDEILSESDSSSSPSSPTVLSFYLIHTCCSTKMGRNEHGCLDDLDGF
ncbi:hypothetical protein NE237_016990 [Protea cynaroides]|uniref:Uncharacterized protein n=1 Tax=Protea cynaroides TaxID=273540 RepID=A0A9Q0K767_9MAGN|nr:hypothetical protein NE237_016990 [Protea cynaroides]